MWKLLSSFYRTEVFLFHWKKENNRDFFRENLKEEFVVYQKVDTNLNFVDREKQVEKFWKENHIFEKSMEDRKDDPTYMFYDGPPTANGKPHIGHVLTRVIKDMIPRYRTMKGYMVPRKAGWDTHGLPVELEVEKKLGLDGKERSRNMVWNHLSSSVKRVSGNIKECGKTFPQLLVSGLIWKIHMLPTMMIISSLNGGH